MRDAEQFIAALQSAGPWREFLREQAASGTATLARAPGRLDVMGGVADYSGALVAEATIAEAALLALRPRTDGVWRFWSIDAARPDAPGLRAEWPLKTLFNGSVLCDYAQAHALLTGDAQTRWASYLMGCVYVLIAEGHAPLPTQGANVLLQSTVPRGAGVSSSAALEVAMMQALNAAWGLNLDGTQIARLAQRAENRVVGAPCGIMDQMASALGTEQSLLAILCRPHTVQGTQAWPEGVRFFGIDTHVEHSVGGGEYVRARVAAFMARRILGVEYLADAPLSSAPESTDTLPETREGAEFLRAYGETGDTATRVNPEVMYPVRAAAEHAAGEHRRVGEFLCLLASLGQEESRVAAGALMYASHESYTRIGLGSDATDLLVTLARQAGPVQGVYGAKITGGGSGGTAVFLTHGPDAAHVIERIAADYQAQTGREPRIVEAGRSPGALAYGWRQWEDE